MKLDPAALTARQLDEALQTQILRSRCRFSSFLNNHDAHLKVWIAEVDLDGVSEAVLMPTHRVCFRRKLTHFYKLLQMFLQDGESSDQHLLLVIEV